MNPISLAAAVVAMLNDHDLEPVAELAFAPVLERDQITQTRILVAPGETLSQVINRAGARVFQRGVAVAVIAACDPEDVEKIGELIDLCDQVGELLSKNRPIAENGFEIAVHTTEINHEPIYDPERLRGGVFVGTIQARYTP